MLDFNTLNDLNILQVIKKKEKHRSLQGLSHYYPFIVVTCPFIITGFRVTAYKLLALIYIYIYIAYNSETELTSVYCRPQRDFD